MINQTEIAAFVESVNAMLAAHYAKSNVKFGAVVEAQIGKKYAKIVKRDTFDGVTREGGSAFCFVDLATGDILKAASWAAPAKGIRGNIAKGLGGLTPYGAIYFK